MLITRFKEMKIIGHEVRTAGSGLQSSSHSAVNSPAGSMGPGDGHLFVTTKKQLTAQQFATDTNVKSAITSWLHTQE